MKQKQRRTGLKEVCVHAARDFPQLRQRAMQNGLEVRYSVVSCSRGRTQTYHFMFDNQKGQRILNYWPGNGRIWAPQTGVKSKVADCWAALEEACRIAAPTSTP